MFQLPIASFHEGDKIHSAYSFEAQSIPLTSAWRSRKHLLLPYPATEQKSLVFLDQLDITTRLFVVLRLNFYWLK